MNMNLRFISYAHLIFIRTKSLSIAVNKELLEPISHWLDDPDFMKHYKLMIDKEGPNWAEYKKQQRYNDMKAAYEALRKKRETAKNLKKLRHYINSIIPRGSPKGCPPLKNSCDFLTLIIFPFSPVEQTRQETLKLFESARTLSIQDRLPWKALIASDLTESKTLNELTTHTDNKTERIAKLQTLLQMNMEGTVNISQYEQFGQITINPVEVDDTNIKIKDQQGNTYTFDWQDLSDNQRNKIIADLQNNTIVKVS